MDGPRPIGKECVRWFGESGSELDTEGIRLADTLSQAARQWFPSNHAPDRFVMMVVVERNGESMTDEEAEDYVRKEMNVKRSVRESR